MTKVTFYRIQFAPVTREQGGAEDIAACDANRKIFDWAVQAFAEWDRHFNGMNMQVIRRTVSSDGTEVDVLIDPETGEPVRTEPYAIDYVVQVSKLIAKYLNDPSISDAEYDRLTEIESLIDKAILAHEV
jgi:hypothetical protein